MDFVNKLRKKGLQRELFDLFDCEYDRNFDYEIKFFEEYAIFIIKSRRNSTVAMYKLTDFDLTFPGDGDNFIGETYYGVSREKSRNIFLKFMKRNFKNYEDEYIKNIDDIARQAKVEIISL